MARPPSPRRAGSTAWRPPEMARSLQSAVELIARASDHAVRLAQEGDRVRPMRVLIELDVFAATPLQPRLARYVAQRIVSCCEGTERFAGVAGQPGSESGMGCAR